MGSNNRRTYSPDDDERDSDERCHELARECRSPDLKADRDSRGSENRAPGSSSRWPVREKATAEHVSWLVAECIKDREPWSWEAYAVKALFFALEYARDPNVGDPPFLFGGEGASI